MLKKLSFLFIFLFSLGYAQDCVPGGDDNTLCLYYGVSDPDAGILEINYSSESEITSLNMFVSPELDILSIESDFSFSELDSESGFINAFNIGNTLPVAEGALLMRILFTPQPIELDACVTEVNIYGTLGLQFTIPALDCVAFESCVADCNSDCAGTAIIDDCGVCSEGNTGHVENSDKDCNLDCFGTASIDLCGVCSEGNTGHTTNSDELGCGCFVDGPIFYYEDLDADGIGYGDGVDYCTELGDETELSSNFTLPPDGWVTVDGDPDPECDDYYQDCAGEWVECGGDHVCLSFSNIDDTGTIEVSYDSYHPISAFQLELNGLDLISVVSDLGDITFNSQTGAIFGISFDGSQLPSGSGVLFSAEFIPYGNIQSACLDNVLIGGSGAAQYEANLPDCEEISGCSNADCANVCGGYAFLDDCDVCSGGITDHVANSDIDCNGDCFGDAFIDDCDVCSEGLSGHIANSDIGCDGACFSGLVFDDCEQCGGDVTFGDGEGDICDCDLQTIDCNGDCGGTADWDQCGYCSEGDTGLTADYNLDLCGVCYDSPDDVDWNTTCGGCMDPNALNYDPDAILSAGECEYLGDVYVALWGDDNSGTGLPDAPFKTIQHAINEANDQDTVVVTPGMYTENNISFPFDKEIVLWGLGGPEETIITDEWQLVFEDDFENDSLNANWDVTGSYNNYNFDEQSYNGTKSFKINASDGWGSYSHYSYSPSYSVGQGEIGTYRIGMNTREDWYDNCNDYSRVYIRINTGNWTEIRYNNCEDSSWNQDFTDTFTLNDGDIVQLQFHTRYYRYSYFELEDIRFYKQIDNESRDINSTNPIFSISDSNGGDDIDSNITIDGFTLDESNSSRGRVLKIENSSSVNVKNIVIKGHEGFFASGYGNSNSDAEDGQYIYIYDSNVDFENISFSDINMFHIYNRYGLINIDRSDVNFDGLSMINIHTGYEEERCGSNEGSAIWMDHGSNVSISNSHFENIKSYTSDTDHGGVIAAWTDNYQDRAISLTINNTNFVNNGINSDNDCGYGGVIFADEYVDLDISNCLFEDNFIESNGSGCRNGGAIYQENHGSLSIAGSTFSGNGYSDLDSYEPIGDGGAIWTNSRDVNIQGSVFNNNYADVFAGAIYFGRDYVNLNIIDSEFTSNRADQNNGGAIRLYKYNDVNISNSKFNNNYSGNTGGAIWTDYHTTMIVDSSEFNENQAFSSGGSFYFYDANRDTLHISNSTIDDNSSGGQGGAIYIWDDGLVELRISNSSLSRNEAIDNGGGICGSGTLIVDYTELNDNNSTLDGGGLYWNYGQVTIERSDIRRNHAGRGGGVFILAENPIFQFDVIAHNDATTIGGGMYIAKQGSASSTPIIFNSTVVYNTSAVLGSGLLCTSQTNPVVQNSIFWGNLAADGVQMHLQGASEIFVTYSNVAGGLSGIVGFDDIIFQDNIDLYPEFEDVAAEDYDLQIISPCIDAGNPNAPVDPDGTIPDQGAYYFAQDGIPNIGTDVVLLDFGGVAVGESKELSLPIYNTGLSELNITDIIIDSNEFASISSDINVGSMETFDVQLAFQPASEGTVNGSVTFVTNDPDEEYFTVNLHGAGDGLAVNSITDIPNDNGGYVSVAWHRNVFDGIDPLNDILNYNIWRRYDMPASNEDNIILRSFETGSRETWELVGSAPAMDLDNYSYTAPTVLDSTAEDGINWSSYMVSAHTLDPEVYFISVPDSGYSVDNLAPSIPDELIGFVFQDDLELAWGNVSDSDLDYYNIYLNNELITTTMTPYFYDENIPAWINLVYQVSSVDFSGNESSKSDPYPVIRTAGDVNEDLTLDVLDLIMLLCFIVDYESCLLDEVQTSIADANFDANIDILDIVLLVNMIIDSQDSSSRAMLHQANSSIINKDLLSVYHETDGSVGYDITLSHEKGFEITELSGSFISDYKINDYSSRIVLIYPTDKLLFTGNIDFEITDVVAVSIDTYIDVEVHNTPLEFRLIDAYPNPFNPTTMISFVLPNESYVGLDVYDLSGRNVGSIASETLGSGYHSYTFDGSNLSSGMYIVALSTEFGNLNQKLLLIK